MMTIKEFAALCGCNAQTLRYYDRIDLLKPAEVDRWSGYRYYAKSQAIDFVKIKNLQAADFTIEEIRTLIRLSDQQIYEAFDKKISEQSQKLERIREIQQTYLAEKSNMENLVQNVADYILNAVSDFEVLREFGLSPADGPAVVEKLRHYLERKTLEKLPAEENITMVVADRVFTGKDNMDEALQALKETSYDDTVLLGDETIRADQGFSLENSECVYSCHDWNYVYEFIDDIPPMSEEYDYCFNFRLTDAKRPKGLEFSLFMIAAMLPRVGNLAMSCCVERSDDDINHFELLRK